MMAVVCMCDPISWTVPEQQLVTTISRRVRMLFTMTAAATEAGGFCGLIRNRLQKARQARLNHWVVYLATITYSGEKAVLLHQPQMTGNDRTCDTASLGQFPYRVRPQKDHLNQAQSDRVSNGAQKYCGLLQAWLINPRLSQT